jgi:glycolate oxidase iron-sulfur subunit
VETHISDESLKNPAVRRMNDVIKSCVHCGFCLSTCPTYLETGSELDSPRGRIYLMKGVLEGDLALTSTLTGHIDRCLGCQACVTACPSGVQYGTLIDTFRPKLEAEYARAPVDRLTRGLLMQTLPYPGRFRLAVTMGRLGKPFAHLMPRPVRAMLSLLPEKPLPDGAPLPEIIPAQGTRRARIALLAGCVQSVLDPDINLATIRVLARNGVEVIVPKGQGCCGALANHVGQQPAARRFARQAIRVFPSDVDAVLTNAAGCGSTLKEYGHLLAGEPDEDAGVAFARRVQDVSQFLAALGIVDPVPALKRTVRVAYHDACHLAHAQGIREEPRALLAGIPNLQLVEIPESEICCGSAGVYNITQPEMAQGLLARKVRHILSTKAEVVAAGNIGCITQMQTGLEARGVQVLHTMQVLDRAYAGTL